MTISLSTYRDILATIGPEDFVFPSGVPDEVVADFAEAFSIPRRDAEALLRPDYPYNRCSLSHAHLLHVLDRYIAEGRVSWFLPTRGVYHPLPLRFPGDALGAWELCEEHLQRELQLHALYVSPAYETPERLLGAESVPDVMEFYAPPGYVVRDLTYVPEYANAVS